MPPSPANEQRTTRPETACCRVELLCSGPGLCSLLSATSIVSIVWESAIQGKRDNYLSRFQNAASGGLLAAQNLSNQPGATRLSLAARRAARVSSQASVLNLPQEDRRTIARRRGNHRPIGAVSDHINRAAEDRAGRVLGVIRLVQIDLVALLDIPEAHDLIRINIPDVRNVACQAATERSQDGPVRAEGQIPAPPYMPPQHRDSVLGLAVPE